MELRQLAYFLAIVEEHERRDIAGDISPPITSSWSADCFARRQHSYLPVMRVFIGTRPSRRDYAIERAGYKTANDVNVGTSARPGWRAVPRGQVCHVGPGR
jgi:hypothetical protein